MDKKQIRKKILEQRDSLLIETRRSWDLEILQKIEKHPYYRRAKSIFIFVSFGSEINTHELIFHALRKGKEVYVPKVISKEKGMEIRKITGIQDLEKGYFGVLEPLPHCLVGDLNQMDLLFVPGVAFDHQGGRIGYGGGFYDRALTLLTKKVPTIGLCYSTQIIKKVPMETFDRPIDELITNDIFECEKGDEDH